jgi:transposase-like protein
MAKDQKVSAEAVVREIRCQTRRKYSAQEKIQIVLEWLRGEENIAELCRREGITASTSWVTTHRQGRRRGGAACRNFLLGQKTSST